MEDLLTNTAQRNNCGVDGYRWMSPQLAQSLECARLLEMDESDRAYDVRAAVADGYPDLLQSATYYAGGAASTAGPEVPPSLSNKEDFYSFGVLLVSMLTRQIPFSNLPWKEAVWKALLNGETPHVPSQYDDKRELQGLEEMAVASLNINPCERPSVRDHIHSLEHSLSEIEFARVSQLKEKSRKELAECEEHVHLLQTTLKDNKEVVRKGNERIAAKEVRGNAFLCAPLDVLFFSKVVCC